MRGSVVGRINGIQRKVNLQCIICNKDFLVWPSDVKNNHKVTCSKECKSEWSRIRPNNGRFKKGHKKCGGYSLGDKHTEESIMKMRISQKGRISPMKGKKHTPETLEKISKSGKGRKPWNKGMIGIFVKEKSMNWQGGKSFEEYGKEFDSQLKERIRFRDGYKCRECGCSQLENGKQLDVHHIDYVKKNCSDNNLISLCKPCHMKTNAKTKREYFIKHYQEKMQGILC